MARPPKPYSLADQTADRLAKQARKRLDTSKRKLNLLDFDELNVLRESMNLYKALYEDCRKEWRKLYTDRYNEMWRYLWEEGITREREPAEDEIDALMEMELSELLFTANPVTKFIFDAEVERKRDRVWEDMMASSTKTQKQLAMDKGIRFWVQMVGWYTDFVSQDAEQTAMVNAGVKKVKRHEMNDDRVCQTCKALDGQIYEIKKIPILEHLRCRRWFTPYPEKS